MGVAVLDEHTVFSGAGILLRESQTNNKEGRGINGSPTELRIG